MLEDYFFLQLKFAAHYAAKAPVPLGIAIERCTNLRRRLNLWEEDGAVRWNHFLAQIQGMPDDPAAQLALCAEYQQPIANTKIEQSYGCFSYDPPDASGTLRIHFLPPKGIGSSPLASTNVAERLAELREMFLHIRRSEPKATSVRGVSWLYNLPAYKRLFPLAYGASTRQAQFQLHLNGTSTWGQVLTWRQEVKTTVRDQLMANLDNMEVEAPWRVFPLKAMVATGQIELFYDMFT